MGYTWGGTGRGRGRAGNRDARRPGGLTTRDTRDYSGVLLFGVSIVLTIAFCLVLWYVHSHAEGFKCLGEPERNEIADGNETRRCP